MTPNIIDNLIAIATLWTSLLWKTSHFEKKLREVEKIIGDANKEMFNKAGLNVLSPRDVALQFVSLLFFFVCFVLFNVSREQVADESYLDRYSWRLSESNISISFCK